MTDSMNFGPEWLRNQISSDGSSTGIGAGGTRYQLADYRYGREEMLALFEKELRAPNSLSTFPALYSEISLPPVALAPVIDDERPWATRGPPMGPAVRGGRGAVGPGDRGGRIARGGGRGGTFQTYGVRPGAFETGGGWGNGEQSDWSPRKEFNYNRSASSGGGVDNWRRSRNDELGDGWRNTGPQGRGGVSSEKWTRTSSWREGDDDRGGPVDKINRSWNEVSHSRGPMNQRRGFENDDHLPEWVTENLGGGGTFDSSGAFHGSDEEQELKVYRRENNLQKSISQQNISSKSQQHVPLSTSKSALSLSKPPEPPSTIANVVESVNHVHENEKLKAIEEKEVMAVKEHGTNNKNKIPIEGIKQSVLPKPQKQTQQIIQQEEANNVAMKGNMNQNSVIDDVGNRVVDEEFEKLQEDLVLKLVVDEEPPTNSPLVTHSNGLPPPPNMMPIQDKWFYQDPQGDVQGPFLSTEMAEWFRAGYFTTTLFVQRQCDEGFYTLGDLVSVCGGGNPFQTFVLAPQKKEKVPDDIQFQYAQQQAMRAAAVNRPFGQGEPWNAINPIQQRELLNQQMMQHYMADTIMLPTNPVHPMRQQILKVNKLAVNPTLEKQPNPIPLDPLQALVHQMGGLQSMQSNRMHVKPNMAHNMSGPPPMKHDVLPSPATLHGIPMNGSGMPIILQNNLIPQNNQIPPSAIPKQPGVNKMDGDNINMLHYLQQKPPVEQQQPNMDLDMFWKTQFGNQQQHMQQPSQLLPPWPATDKPISMWDMPQSGPANMSSAPPEIHQINNENINIKDNHKSDVNNDAIAAAAIAAAKEEKKRKEQEEKQAKKEADEKRKMEQRKQEAEKKLQEEKRKKEDDRVKKEMEKVKKEAEEKRQRELAEKRRLKEKRKADEEARKKAEELRKLEEQEREKLAAKEREEQQKKQAEFARQQAINNQNWGKTAPWSQSSSNQGLSLSEIQKLERERKAEQVALLQQQRVLQMQEQTPEKPTNIQLSWANKPMKASNVKSLAEIQAEEQEKCQNMVKQQASLQHKEKETKIAAGIWSGQSLTWTNNHDTSGFWEEPPQRQGASKVNNVQETTKTVTPKQTPKSQKTKANKKDENPNNSNSSTDEFTEWCTKTLANMNTTVDIPTFISFLRDIESAMDVRDYCREYLGEKPAIQQFAAQFLEKRRLFKPKVTTHKDDLCSPAPAITPSAQHNNSDFQEVKSKGRKCKRKMLKVDSRILGFNVTAAQDRINVGDRDYGVHEGEGGKKLSSFLRQGGANLDSGICWADGPLAL